MNKRLLSLTVGSILLATQAFAAPRLIIPETEFNFGFVPQNSTVAHEFWLKSAGDDTLKILAVKPG